MMKRRDACPFIGCFVMIAGVGLAAAAPPTTAAKPSPARYTVRRGQTLYSIARAHGVTLAGLAAANGIRNPSLVRAGTRLVIPPSGSRPRSASRKIPAKPPRHMPDPPGMPPGAPADLPAPLPPSLTPALPDMPSPMALSWPVEGRIISGFDRPRRGHRHRGVDISSASGTPIHAAAGGVVAMVEESFGNYGRLVSIEHDNGLVTYYGHNMKNLVRPGQRVSAQDVIALVGRSGNASCAHVHFEIRLRGEAIDPTVALGRMGETAAAVARQETPAQR